MVGFSQTNTKTPSTPSDTSSRANYSLFWGLFKSKNFKPVKVEPIKFKGISLDSLAKDTERKQVLWGAIQWTKKKKNAKIK